MWNSMADEDVASIRREGKVLRMMLTFLLARNYDRDE